MRVCDVRVAVATGAKYIGSFDYFVLFVVDMWYMKMQVYIVPGIDFSSRNDFVDFETLKGVCCWKLVDIEVVVRVEG